MSKLRISTTNLTNKHEQDFKARVRAVSVVRG